MIENSRSRMLYLCGLTTLGAAALIAIVWIAIAVRLQTETEHALRDIDLSNANIALGLEAHTYNFFGSIDTVLILVRHQFLQKGNQDLRELARQSGTRVDLLLSIHVIDVGGKQVNGTAPLPPGIENALLVMVSTIIEDRLFLGKPRLDAGTGKWVIDVARRIQNPDGTLGGLVIGSADADGLTSYYKLAQLGPNDLIMLVKHDGEALLRVAGGKVKVGEDLRGSSLMKAFAAAPRGTFITKGQRERVKRFTTYRGMTKMPLVAAAGTSREETLAVLSASARMHYAFAAVTTAALLALAFALIRILVKRQAAVWMLAKDEARFRATFDQAFIGMAQADADGKPLQVNKTLCVITGATETELLARPLAEFIHPEDRVPRDAAEAEWPVEKRLVRKDGTVAWVNIATTRVRDPDGHADCLVTVVQDITEFKRVDRMKSEFVSIVSHELRTPLTSIRGSLGLLGGGVAGALPAGAKKLVDIANSNCERLIRLINDMLDTDKIESGKMRFDLRRAPLAALVQNALDANEGFARQHEVTFRLMVAAHSIVEVDPDRLEQVITNLLSNAAKFAPPGSEVEVRLSRANGRARVEVADRGPGIPDEFRARIFQKFSQADSSDSRNKGGTGLGLNISMAIVERLGGTIGFTSEPGAGTTFHFELPEVSGGAEAESKGSSSRPRVLVCEDEPDIAVVIGMMLANAGYDTDVAHTAAQARGRLAHTDYAAMTVDLKLPDQDGISLIRELRGREATAHLPIIVLSARAEEGRLSINGQERTVSDWLAKPIDESRLLNALRRAIESALGGRPRILLVEDDAEVQCIVAAIAQDIAAFEFAPTLAEARAQLREHRFDLVIMDMELPDGAGGTLLDEIDGLDSRPTVVVLSRAALPAADRDRVAAVLVKSQASNDQIRETLCRALASHKLAVAEAD